jgi:hypothetical protein
MREQLTPKEVLRILRPALRFRIIAGVSAVLFAGGIVLNASKLAEFIGKSWPPNPAIVPQEVARGTALVLPFKITNRSEYFDINDVAMSCGVDLMLFEDADGKRGGGDSMAFMTGVFSIPAGATLNYPCDASGLVSVLSDGNLTLRGELTTKGGSFRAPLKILKMCIWVGGDYQTGPFPRSFTSNIFKWPAAQTAPQWVEGPTAWDQTKPEKLPTSDPDRLDCRTSPSGPYVYFRGAGAPYLVFDITRRPKIN